jgi:hypothetical protein
MDDLDQSMLTLIVAAALMSAAGVRSWLLGKRA